ncbi:MAG: hypothetical protein M5U27_16960 [Gaiella sp.]|nr:hypothetical protein [Gaiella sp.]
MPIPSSPHRKPIEPFGTTGSPVSESTRTVFHSAFSPVSPRSDARRNRSATYAPSRSRSVTRKGRSVVRLTYESNHGTFRSTWNSLKTTCAIAIASAPSVPASAGSQWSANFVCPA